MGQASKRWRGVAWRGVDVRQPGAKPVRCSRSHAASRPSKQAVGSNGSRASFAATHAASSPARASTRPSASSGSWSSAPPTSFQSCMVSQWNGRDGSALNGWHPGAKASLTWRASADRRRDGVAPPPHSQLGSLFLHLTWGMHHHRRPAGSQPVLIICLTPRRSVHTQTGRRQGCPGRALEQTLEPGTPAAWTAA